MHTIGIQILYLDFLVYIYAVSNLGRILKGQRLHACVQKCSQQEGGVGTRRDDGWKTAWFCCYLCDICPVRRICAGRRAPVSVGRAWLCALLPVHGYVTFLPGQNYALSTKEHFNPPFLVLKVRHPASLIPRPFPPPVFDCLQYANTEGEGL